MRTVAYCTKSGVPNLGTEQGRSYCSASASAAVSYCSASASAGVSAAILSLMLQFRCAGQWPVVTRQQVFAYLVVVTSFSAQTWPIVLIFLWDVKIHNGPFQVTVLLLNYTGCHIANQTSENRHAAVLTFLDVATS
jgi:hypothetical protein